MILRRCHRRLRCRRGLRRLGLRIGRVRLRRRGRSRGGGGKLYVDLGGLGRHIDLVLSDLTVPLRSHLIAGPLIGYHLRERLCLRGKRLLILGRRRRSRRRIWLLIGRLILRRGVDRRPLRLGRPVDGPLLHRKGRR